MCKKLIYLLSFILLISLADNSSADLVVHWRLDEGSGTTAYDSSGNGYDGEFVGTPEWVEGHNSPSALHFRGDSEQDSLLHALDSTSVWTNFTIALWVKADSLGQDQYSSPFTYHNPNTAGIQFDVDGQTPGNYRINPGGVAFGVASTDWVHLALTCEGGSATFYYDGEQTNTATLSDSQRSVNEFALGINRNHSNWFAGTIDDFRVYDHVLSEVEILGTMTGQPWPYAFGPEPADGVMNEDTWVNLSWRPGDFAVSHDVYIGDNFDDVDKAAENTFVGNQEGTFLVVGFPGFPFPDGLVPGTTYYWRIDEVNEAEPNSPWKGDIWRFSVPPKTAYFPDPADGAETVDVDPTLSWTPGFGAKLHNVYFGETFDEVDNATGALPQGSATYSPGTLKMAKTYYWRVDEFDVVETHRGDVWSFTTEGAVAAINPVEGAMDVTQTPVLTWSPGFGASHEVYFGVDVASLELKGSGYLGSESYEPGQLEWNTTYYWRVDEVNNANPDSPWTGPLWSFTTANFLIIDDMESYNDIDEGEPGSNRIYLAWVDGYDNPAINGSVVGHPDGPPFAELTIVHSGNQSMPMYYYNAVGKSEATLTLTSNRDWTVNDVDTLTIWFRGEAGNAAEQMYVALNGSARVDHDDPEAATSTSWKEWNIDLQAFADQGVNLTNVTSITLGLSSVTGGTGIMYFDDIRLYTPAP